MQMKEMQPGEKGRVLGIKNTQPHFRRRLLTFGMTPGAQFEILRVAPLGDPIEIRVRGSFMSIRRDEADLLDVERTE